MLGRQERTDSLSAAYLNALSASAHAFDDTHLETVVHPTATVAASLLAAAERRELATGSRMHPISGKQLLDALILGIEIQIRLGTALLAPPAQGQLGWYASGIAGGVSAAAASSRIMGLSSERACWAMGLAANQASGFRQTHGSMCTSFVPAHAARCGLQAAVLAERGFTASEKSLEGKNGYFDVFAIRANPAAAIASLGEQWYVQDNTFKPYPCGIVIHPVLDACLAFAANSPVDIHSIEKIVIEVNPLCLILCDRPEPENSQLAQVSVQHWAAAALARGRAGLAEGDDNCVNDPAVVSLRRKVSPKPNLSLTRDAAKLTIETKDGKRIKEQVIHCLGSAERPMTDDQLSTKFLDQAGTVLNRREAELLLAKCWSLENHASFSEIFSARVSH
ncbi:MAG: 2-methylcitrate dehydratase [Rhodospirillaceae bacterium]|nr:2-methylcitrate dehydratase [Rhodospirillaceae bacterium]